MPGRRVLMTIYCYRDSAQGDPDMAIEEVESAFWNEAKAHLEALDFMVEDLEAEETEEID